MNIAENLKELIDRAWNDVKIFLACSEVEIIGKYLDVEIIGSDRKNIKIKTLGKVHRHGICGSIVAYYKIMFREEEGKLVIKNDYITKDRMLGDISPVQRYKLIIELPKFMAVTIMSEGIAFLNLSHIEGNLNLDLNATGANLFNVRDLTVVTKNHSNVIMFSSKAENVKMQLSAASAANILKTVEIKNLEATIDRSSLKSDGKLKNASFFWKEDAR